VLNFVQSCRTLYPQKAYFVNFGDLVVQNYRGVFSDLEHLEMDIISPGPSIPTQCPRHTRFHTTLLVLLAIIQVDL
jgi:hypothetical protein